MADNEIDLLKALARSVNDMRTEVRGEFKAVRAEMDKRFDAVDEQFSELKGELAAVRDVVDNELASQSQVNQIEQDLREIKREQRKQGKAIDRLTKERA